MMHAQHILRTGSFKRQSTVEAAVFQMLKSSHAAEAALNIEPH
jgi:hypothetical protein